MLNVLGATPVVLTPTLTLTQNPNLYPYPEEHNVETTRNATIAEIAARIERLSADDEHSKMVAALADEPVIVSEELAQPFGVNGTVIVSEELAQPFGVNAIGTTVCREFGTDGVFYGVISAFHTVTGKEDLYTVEYNDGDVEDLDLEEYNYAYALWLKEEGWQVDEAEPNAVYKTGASSTKKKKDTQKERERCSTTHQKESEGNCCGFENSKAERSCGPDCQDNYCRETHLCNGR
jgi:hypothetical protein